MIILYALRDAIVCAIYVFLAVLAMNAWGGWSLLQLDPHEVAS